MMQRQPTVGSSWQTSWSRPKVRPRTWGSCHLMPTIWTLPHAKNSQLVLSTPLCVSVSWWLHSVCAHVPGSPGVMELGAAEASPVVQRLKGIQKTPVFSLMVALRAQDLGTMRYDAASVSNHAAVQWVSRDTSKPGGLFPSGCMLRVG